VSLFSLLKKNKKVRGFEIVRGEHVIGGVRGIIPTRADKRSAGYDFYATQDIEIATKATVTIWTNVKAYMLPDEALNIYVGSSVGTKLRLRLANQVGVIDASYYENEDNDGNIGIALYNYSGQTVRIPRGERIAQGVFIKYLTADIDNTLHAERVGGYGSSNRMGAKV